jgi:hypothetical protein
MLDACDHLAVIGTFRKEAPDKRMARVAIIGSCITRDLWPRTGGGAEDLVYVSRTSLPSLFSPPVAGFRPERSGLTPHQHSALLADLRKTALVRLIAFEPSHVVFDFIDERFDLLDVNGALVSETWELTQSGYGDRTPLRRAHRIPRLSMAAERLWRRGAEEMAAFIRATPLRNAVLVLHVSRWATDWRDAAGRIRPLSGAEILAGRPANIAEHNTLLADYEKTFLAVMPPVVRVDAGAFRIADAGHQWGLSPFHFVPEYYAEIWRQFEAIGIARAPSESPALPSVPAV